MKHMQNAHRTDASEGLPNAPQTALPWKRFWVPRDGEIWLTAGFLVDPSDLTLRTLQPDVRSFDELNEHELLVLLGEAGLGKSFELRSQAKAVASQGTAVRSFYLNLADTADESRLIGKIREAADAKALSEDGIIFHLFLDSLDEAMLTMPKVVECIADAIKVFPAGRLRLRLGCRTGAWLDAYAVTLSTSFQWSSKPSSSPSPPSPAPLGKVEKRDPRTKPVFELLQLREEDVTIACQAKNINAEAFLEAVKTRGVEPLAAHPITLTHLLGLYSRASALPNTTRETYDQGILQLIEVATERDPKTRKFTPVQLLSVVRRIAAALMFNKNQILHHHGAEVDDSGLKSMDLCGGTEGEGPSHLAVDSFAIDKAIADTGLLSGRGIGIFGFSHKSYMEVLAAQFFENSPFSSAQIRSLLFVTTPDGVNRVPPQFVELVAWIAAGASKLSRDVRTKLLNDEPELLLRAGFGSFDEDVRASMCHGILNRFDRKQIARDIHMGTRTHYGRLRSSKLAPVLTRFIRRKTAHEDARDAAIAIAEACDVKEIVPLCVKLALDSKESLRLRDRAAHAVVELGTDAECDRLLPLVHLDASKEEHRSLRAYGMRACWPRSLSTCDLLPLIVDSPNHTVDAYAMFVQEAPLEEKATLDELPSVIKWAGKLRDSDGIDTVAGRLGSLVLHRAWTELPNPAIAPTLAQAVFARAATYSVAFRRRGKRPMSIRDLSPKDVAQEMRADGPRCEALLLALAESAHSPEAMVYVLMKYRDFLIDPSRFTFWLDRATMATGEKARIFTEIARSHYDGNQPAHYAAWFDAKDCSETIRHFFKLETECELDSEAAKFARMEKNQAPKAPKELSVLDMMANLSDALVRAESEDVRWWHRVRQILEHGQRHAMPFDLTATPVWMAIETSTRERVLSAALRYLTDCPVTPPSSEDNNTIHGFAAVQALGLLLSSSPIVLDQLDKDRFDAIAEALVEGLNSAGGELRPYAGSILAYVAKRAEAKVTSAVVQIVERSAAREWLPSILNILPLTVSGQVAKELLKRTRTVSFQRTKIFPSVLSWLLELGHGATENLCVSLVKKGPRLAADKRGPSLAAAEAIASRGRDSDWPLLWNAIHSNPGWGDEFLMAAAPHGFGNEKAWTARLSISTLGTLLEYLLKRFDPGDDPQHNEAYSPTHNDNVREWRTRLLNHVSTVGTTDALAVVKRIEQNLPQYDWLYRSRLTAEFSLAQALCPRLSLYDLLTLRERSERRTVASAEDLCQVVLESLSRLESRLQKKMGPMRSFLWNLNGKTPKPRDEESFSDFVKDHLEMDLGHSVVINREVQISRMDPKGYAKGKRLDLLIQAMCHDTKLQPVNTISIAIEVKGCWNPDVLTSMKKQLRDRYLSQSQLDGGVYLVGWYARQVGRKIRPVPRSGWKTVVKARGGLNKQVAALRSGCDKPLHPLVIDCGLK